MESDNISLPMPPVNRPLKWFVMTFWDSRHLKDWLVDVNAQRLSRSQNIITTFSPYDFLSHRAERINATVDAEDEGAAFNIFKHVIFVRTTLRDALRLTTDRENREGPVRLRFYLDTDGNPAVVADRMMEAFINACVEKRGTFRLIPPISGIEANDKVRIEEGPFAGYEATVLRTKQSKGVITLDLSIPLVSGAINIRMEDVKRHQIAILNRETTDAIRADFIDYTQRNLVSILAHRIKRVQDSDVHRRDADLLNRIYRYRSYEVESDSAATHFLALMLICAHLCKDQTGEAQLIEQAQDRLAAINEKSASRAATNIRTYLWIALYIATGDTEYSRLAKDYVKTHQPKSRYLKRFVALIRKGKKV